ncbi:hypothetical protein SVIO_074130 [Streptomyces violaceusniger]|uniref:Uncharacterized protein n=1 Tax=Streptomyces violaceusniger TaxID=68280 RepID=A0A4D4LCL3_STRVO|nr:hypothetical protein SVIO_074130 [Streptomyces violaceusniger]
MTGGRKRPYAPESLGACGGLFPSPPLPETGASAPDPGRPSGVSSISPSYRWEVPPDGLKSAPPAIEERGLGRSPSFGKGKRPPQLAQCPAGSPRRSRNQ